MKPSTSSAAPATPRITARFDLTATALEPIAHGAGTVGNLTRLRKQEFIGPDGELVEVPFISGNSFRHKIREGAVRFALEAMGQPEGFTKAIVDLLFSGGHLNKAGAAVDLTRARRMEQLFPALSLMGYSAGNVMVESKITVRNWHVVCAENRFRLPPTLADSPHAKLSAGQVRVVEFSTRREATRSPHVNRLLTDGERERLDAFAAAKLRGEEAGKGDSSQMISHVDVIKAGTTLWSAIIVHDISHAELAALQGGLMYACEGTADDGGLLFSLGAKSRGGYGLVSVHVSGKLRDLIAAPTYTESAGLVPAGKDAYTAEMDAYVARLREHREEILSFFHEVLA